MDVVVWLRGFGLGKYEAVFRENEINERVLPSLTVEDLKGTLRERAASEAVRTCSDELVPLHVRARCRDSLSFPTVKGCPSTGSMRSLASRTLLVLLTLISTLDAAETNVCTVAANPSGFDHRQVTLRGIVAGLSKSTSRSGHKQMTFLLRSPLGCGGVIVYAQEPATLSNGDHLQVEGIFEMERRRDGSTFHNEIQAMKITTLPR